MSYGQNNSRARVAPWQSGAVFDDVGTKFLGDAFDTVFAMLHGAQYPDHVREVIADRILEFGRTMTERDPERLARAVVTSLGIKL